MDFLFLDGGATFVSYNHNKKTKFQKHNENQMKTENLFFEEI